MKKQRKFGVLAVWLLTFALAVTGCRDDKRENTSSAETSTEDLTLGSTGAHTVNFTEDFTHGFTGEYAENSTEDPGEEGETLSEEELLGQELKIREEQLSGFWHLLLEEVYSDYQGSQEYRYRDSEWG